MNTGHPQTLDLVIENVTRGNLPRYEVRLRLSSIGNSDGIPEYQDLVIGVAHSHDDALLLVSVFNAASIENVAGNLRADPGQVAALGDRIGYRTTLDMRMLGHIDQVGYSGGMQTSVFKEHLRRMNRG
ncbi:hypothetical protein [Paenibacillus sp. FSL R5-0908]|uniref:hypothetical protein n=1 Tax=Paenibacillus sp. FSL R5-0908 TaxID=2921664 RepID=UPI0030F86899